MYSFLHLLADPCSVSGIAKLEHVKRLEIKFCVIMFREQLHLSLKIGRDLVRLLQDLVYVSEFEDIWNDKVSNHYSDTSQFYRLKTSSRFLELCRQNHHTEQSAKLTLFYDWLFFDDRIDNIIMNVEPSALLMVRSTAVPVCYVLGY
ncbi:hypothetical protein ARALYDRAFT_911099 [Arabidopsis lyrata subsp. lyrata]|uniref:Integrator complex subunit 3 N-terminal domain-containing protein n=1 Tax=Arabidopsis lyrata subsp. lyrata TaxID=81972 RepID=D7M8D3_ARALL|nr:hypothetical protein ARALYDRAFT_911099 [Arabidopsis lyrata subsp. lyrata]